MTAPETAPEAISPDPHLWLTTAEVCERLRISRSKFYILRRKLKAAGREPQPVQLGIHTLRWPVSELPALVEALAEAAAS